MAHTDDFDKLITGARVDFVIVTPLEEERDAVLTKLPNHRKLPPTEDDIRVYYSSELPATFPDESVTTYNVVVMTCGKGRVNGIAAASDAIRRWHPYYIILVGIAGGIAARGVKLGDVLISDQIVDYELQKLTPTESQKRWEVYRASSRLIESARNLGDGWQGLVAVKRPDDQAPSRHIGPTASGDKVIAFGDILRQLCVAWPKLIGVEMEAGGVAVAASQAPDSPRFFMIRAVSDFADEEKGTPEVEAWRSYACDVAASYAIALLQSGPIPSASSEHHGAIAPDFHKIESQLDELSKKISEVKEPAAQPEPFNPTQVSEDTGFQPVFVAKNLVPYLRTIERQEEVLSKYKNATEKQLKRELDKAVELIQNYQLRQAQVVLETLRDELLSIPEPDQIDINLREGLYRLLGICHTRLGNLETAIANLEVAESIGGKTEKLGKALLEYYTIKGDYDVASKMAHEMLAIDLTLMEAKNTLAIIQLKAENFDQVIESYEGDQQANDDPSSQSILAFAHLRLGNFALALGKARRFVGLAPRLPQAYETLGNAYLATAYKSISRQIELRAEWFQEIVDKDSLHKAIENYQRALELYTSSGQYHLSEAVRINLANALSSDKRLDEALRLIEENLKSASTPLIENLVLKAQLEDEAGNLDRAIVTCLHTLELFPNDCRLMITIGGLYLNKQEPEEARKWLERAKTNCTDPKEFAFLEITHSKTYLFENNRDNAWACLQDVPDMEKETVSFLLAVGDYYYHFKNYSEAERYYHQALSRDPDNLGLLDRIVRFCRSFREPAKALTYAEKFARLVNTPLAYSRYVELLIEASKPREALTILISMLQSGPGYPTIILQEAMCRQQLGQFSDAIRLYEQYLQNEPDSFIAAFNLGICYQCRGQREKAIQAFITAEKLRPDDVQVQAALALMYQIEEKRQDAYHHAHKALELAPDNPDMYLFFFQVAYFCGYEEEAVKILTEVPKRFPEYEHLKAMTIEEAKEIFASSQEYYRQIKQFYQSGNLPFALVAKWLNKPLALIWRVFSYDKDVRMLCALGSLEEQRTSHTLLIQANQVVIDFSALLTLHHLGLADLPTRLFGKVYLAQGAFDQLQQDISFLVQSIPLNRIERLESILNIIYQHPKFQRQTEWLESSLILDAQQAEGIRPFYEQDILLAKQHRALYLLDNSLIFSRVEQVLPDQVTTTKRLADNLLRSGKLKQTDHEKACTYLAKTHQLDDCGTENVTQFKTIVASHQTLETLFETNLLDLLVTEFDVIYISLPTLSLLKQGIGEIKFHQELLETVKVIEATIKNNNGYCVQSSAMPEALAQYHDDEGIDKSFMETFSLARELQLPIWTDDLASRKFASNGGGKIGTFDTRIVLDVAINRRHITRDQAGNSILSLLKWGYYFIPINSSIIYWSVKQHSFHPNPDSDLLLLSLDESIAQAYKGLDLRKKPSGDETNSEQLADKDNMYLHNLRVYADFLLILWYNIPFDNRLIRSRWTLLVFERVSGLVEYGPMTFHLAVICISKMLQSLDNEKLDHFLVLCTNSLMPAELTDAAILLVLGQFYNGGNYSVHELQLISKLLDNLRWAQYNRVTLQFRKLVKDKAGFFSALRAIKRSSAADIKPSPLA